MSTPAVTPDPYAAYGGKVAMGSGTDPYAAYGGKVAAPPAAAPDTRNSFQRGVDELARYVGHPEDRGAGQPNAANRFGEGIVQGALQPLAHPLDSLTGAVESVLHPVNTATAMAHSAAQNPAGFAGQLVGGAALGEGAGEIAAPLADVTSKSIGKAALLGKTPAEAYESALKPSVTLDASTRASAVRGGLEEGIPVSKSGVEKIGDLIDDYNQKVKEVVAQDPTRPIDPNKVATRADSAKARFARQVNAQEDVNAIEAAKQQFLNEQGARPGTPAIPPRPTGILDMYGKPIMGAGTPAQLPTPAPPMNAADAQAMKSGTYSALGNKAYGELKSASIEGQKDLARGLKEEIATQFPELNNLNAAESRLLDLQPILEKAVNRAGNQGMFRLGTGAVAGTFKALGASNKVAGVAAVMKQVLDDPMIKSRLAIAVSKGGKIPYAQAVARIGAYSSALGSAAAGSQAYSNDDNSAQSTSGQP